jgi:type IV pilus assembly protein PilM
MVWFVTDKPKSILRLGQVVWHMPLGASHWDQLGTRTRMAHTVVGLDIGSSGVRAAEFAIGRRTPGLRKVGSVPLPPGTVRDGAVADGEALAAALRDLWSQSKFTTKEVALGVANAGVLVRQMDLDWMPAEDFAKALRYQVEDALPMPVDEANLDYHLLDEVVVPGEGDESRRVMRVLLVAAARDMVDAFVEAAHEAGLRPVSVDIIPFALIRATCPARVEGDSPAEAIVDIGADTVTIAVHEGGQPRYVRTLTGHGGEVITHALQEKYDWTREEAERTKIVVGLPGHADLDALQGLAGDHGALDHLAQEVIAAEVEALVAEIRTTLDYFRGSAAEPSVIARVLLTGSGAQLAGLPGLLADRLGVTVESLNVADRVRKRRRLRLSDDARSLAIPVGLCTGVSL